MYPLPFVFLFRYTHHLSLQRGVMQQGVTPGGLGDGHATEFVEAINTMGDQGNNAKDLNRKKPIGRSQRENEKTR